MILLGQPATTLAGNLCEDFVEASVKLLGGEHGHRRGLRAQDLAGCPARPWRAASWLIDRHGREVCATRPAERPETSRDQRRSNCLKQKAKAAPIKWAS